MSMSKYWRVAVVGLVCAAFASPALASPCPGTNVIVDPEPFQWTYHPVTANNPQPYYSGTLEVGQASFDISGESLITRAYRQEGGAYAIPGPTMHLSPGEKYVLSFHNLLPYEAPSTQTNVLKDPNISNIHTHGVHISGESPSDDITRSFEGGFGGDFVYDMPADHMGGTFWYHAHHHGSTMLQVAGGLFGLIVVDDSGDGIPANVAAMEERELVVAFLDTSVAGAGGDTLLDGSLSPSWTVNGNLQGNLCVPPDTWQHWRVLVADRDAREKSVSIGPECEVALLARDGVWRTVAPKDLTTNTLGLTGASRADLAVRCSADSQILVDNSPVASIYVDGTADPAPHPYAADGVSQWSAARPDYLRDLTAETGVNTESVRMGARTINGNKFDPAVPTFTLPADAVQEWSINGAAQHPFHLHVYHVQSFGCGGDFEDGEYYDVIASNCDVRFDLTDATSSVYDGRTIMHCHILGHEDQGAMGWLDVVGGDGPPTFPQDGDLAVPYSEYYPLGGGQPQPPAAPTNLAATAVSSSAIDLVWTDNASDEDGFDIERSDDGVLFQYVTSVGANTEAWSDAGLAANTTYDYRVTAYNAAGSSGPSNVASATTFAGGMGSALDVGSITVTTVNAGQGNKFGRAVVGVVDDLGNPIAGAVVSGDFSGTFTEAVAASDPTDASGSTVIDTAGTAKGNVTVTFCVTGITHPDYTDFSGQVCGSN